MKDKWPIKNQLSICFYGSSGDSETLNLVEDKDLQKDISNIADNILSLDYERFKIVTGGYHGIMYLIAKIFKENARKFDKTVQTVGITCDAYDVEEISSPTYNRYNAINNVNDIVIQAESFPARIQAMVESADVFVMLRGKQGTLSEFLMTAETYSFSIEMLKHKNVRILVDVFWKPLITNENFFRDFKNIVYFKDTNELKSSLIGFKSSELKFVHPNYPKPFKGISGTFLRKSFKNYCATIEKIMYGKLTESDTIKEELGYHGNVLAVDFGYILDQNAKESEGEFVSNSTKTYLEYLNLFFENNNSIMLNSKENQGFEVKFFNGKVVQNPRLKFMFKKNKDSTIPKFDKNKKKAIFSDWAEFLDEKDYGQTLVWRGICQTGEQNSFKLNLSIFLLFNCHLPSRKIEKIRQVTDDFFLTVSTRKIVDLFKDKEIELKNQATKAAISQVMARNMSHNIGSHVLSKFKDEVEIHEFYLTDKNKQYIASALNPGLTEKQQIAYFNEYLKNRMDFLADIATTDPVMETTMYFVRDIIKGFDKNRILLNRISGVSDLKRFGIICKYNDTQIKNTDHSKDPLLSIPNEVIGAQAFYIIIENIIRNIYKHGNPSEDFDIHIAIKDYDINNTFYEISIYDSIRKDTKLIDKIVRNRNSSFNESILKNNSVRDNNLGTIEMDVCAAYLRCLPIINVENDSFRLGQKDKKSSVPKLIYAYKHLFSASNSIIPTNNECTLGYKFYLSKPKEVLVLSSAADKFTIGNLSNEELANRGIRIINEELLKKHHIYNHQLLYLDIDEANVSEYLFSAISELPKRIVLRNPLINKAGIDDFIKSVWECYILEKFHFENKIFHLINEKNEAYVFYKKDAGIEIGEYKNIPSLYMNNIRDVLIDNHNSKWSHHSDYDYYDMACGHSKIEKVKDKIFQNNVQAAAEYIEVVDTRVIILDERIQQNLIIENKVYKANGISTPFGEYFKKQGVLIPSKDEVNLNAVSFGKFHKSEIHGQSVSDKIKRYIKSQISEVNFVVIHLGVLEKMIPSDQEKSPKKMGKIIQEIFGLKDAHKLVVTSGRGKPNNLPDKTLFVPLALIQNAIETQFDKFLLTKILFNSRKSQSNGK